MVLANTWWRYDDAAADDAVSAAAAADDDDEVNYFDLKRLNGMEYTSIEHSECNLIYKVRYIYA